MPDAQTAGLDPAHIVGICNRATGNRHSLAVRAPQGICVYLPSRRAAGSAGAALTRVGYHVGTPVGGGRNLTVGGWSTAGLEGRLAAMRNVLHQLAADPSTTAAATLEQFRDLPPGTVIPRVAFQELLETARIGLRDWVSRRSGIHAAHDPAVHPPDLGVALRLRMTWVMEQSIDDLTERHLYVARRALALFSLLRGHTPAGRAQQMALHWAGTTFRPGGPATRAPSLLIPRTARPGDGGSSPRPGARADNAQRGTVLDFPTPITRTVADAQPLTDPTADPGRPRSAAPRPGPTHGGPSNHG